MEEQQELKITHKIEAGKKYRVFKNTVNDRDYYKIGISQKNYDGTKTQFYEGVTFKKGVELRNGSDIIIKSGFENCRINPADKYNPIFYLVITDFELCQNQEQIQEQALQDYRNGMDETEEEMVGTDDNFLD